MIISSGIILVGIVTLHREVGISVSACVGGIVDSALGKC